jgi:hypothetical protein
MSSTVKGLGHDALTRDRCIIAAPTGPRTAEPAAASEIPSMSRFAARQAATWSARDVGLSHHTAASASSGGLEWVVAGSTSAKPLPPSARRTVVDDAAALIGDAAAMIRLVSRCVARVTP